MIIETTKQQAENQGAAQLELVPDNETGEAAVPPEQGGIRLMDNAGFVCHKERTVCFSGHRPERLPIGADIVNVIKSYLAYEISEAIGLGFDTFIMGGSRGIDLWAGLAVISEKAEDERIKLIAALPYHTPPSRFSERERFDYGSVLERCDEIYYAAEYYTPGCMKRRNLFMTEHSSRLVAFVRDYRSGTGQTIRLAQKLGLQTHIYDVEKFTEF
jgi:uncharacterized phage-like protein YoqJ